MFKVVTFKFFEILKKELSRFFFYNSQAKLNVEMRCLALDEFLTILIPGIYCLSFTAAYYGPNAEIIGNVKNDYWRYEKVDDLGQKLNLIFIFFVIDAIRAMIFGLVLWIFYRLNLYAAYCYTVYRYGVYISFRSAFSINWVIAHHPFHTRETKR